MKNWNAITHVAVRYATLALALAIPSVGAWAQDATTVSVQHGTPTYNTEVKNAEIVYVQDNDLVLKLENGKVEHLVVPDSDRFTIGGKEVAVCPVFNQMTPRIAPVIKHLATENVPADPPTMCVAAFF